MMHTASVSAQQAPPQPDSPEPGAAPTRSPIELLFPAPLPTAQPEAPAPTSPPSPVVQQPEPTNPPAPTPTAEPSATLQPPAPSATPDPADILCLRCAASPSPTRTATPSPVGEETVVSQESPTPTRTNTPSPSPTATIVPPPPIRYAGVPSASTDAGWIANNKLWLAIPHRTQFDSTPYAQSNCGPSSLAMILEAYGLKNYPVDVLRGEVNRIQGNSDPSQGTSLPALAAVAQRAGLYPVNMHARPAVYARWTLDDITASLKAGRPLIVLTRYGDLPGNAGYEANTNHYIVLSGLSGDQFIYNDPAYPQGRGSGLLISPETLRRAMHNSVIPGQGVAFALGTDGAGLLHPNRLGSGAADGEIELVDEDELLKALEDESLENLSLAFEDVAAFEPGFVDESRLFATNVAPTPTPLPPVQLQSATPRGPDPAPGSGFPLGRAATIIGLVVLGAYAPGAVAILIGHMRQ
jgi:hypothetical protein